MPSLIRHLHQKLHTISSGQSMVELAIIAPIIIFMMIGTFEVGWALRGYLILVNVSREATRFAVRPNYLDFSEGERDAVGYEKVLTHTLASLGNRLPLDFATNSKLIISHMVVDTALPCDPDSLVECDCDEFTNPDSNYNAANTYIYDDLILHPNSFNREFYVTAFPTQTITTTLVNYELEIVEQTHQNNKFNCEILKKGGVPSANNYITTELFYDQPQLFGFPLISNPLTDPISLYTRTSMRLINGARNTENADVIGPVCEAHPFVIQEGQLTGKLNQKVDIFGGPSSTHAGWLAWNPSKAVGAEATPYLEDELRTSRVPLNDFINARDAADTVLEVGDTVASLQGSNTSVETFIKFLVGRTIRIPVYDTFSNGGGGQQDAYHISSFAWVRIESISDINLSAQTVYATYLGEASEACLADGSDSLPGGTTPTPTPTVDASTATPTAVLPTATNTPMPTAINTPLPTATNTPMQTATATKTPTATSTKTPTSTPVPALHVQFITVNVVKDSKKDKYRGEVTVMVVDQNGQPVKGAKVYGSWSGAISESEDGDTNSAGIVSETSSYVNNIQGPFQYCVTNIVDKDYVYNTSANVQTCVSASY